jgi:hypothetical protein
MGSHFIIIPVYRLPTDQYYAERDAYVKNKIYPGPPETDEKQRQFYLRNPDSENRFTELLFTEYGGAWDFNEIIGYIGLYFLGCQIRSEYWRMKGKRICRTRKKQFEFMTWRLVPEESIPANYTNVAIFELIREYLNSCSKELKGRYLNTRCFELIGPHIDWRSLLRKFNS